MSFMLSNIYLSGPTTLEGKLEFSPQGLVWYSKSSERRIELLREELKSFSWYDFGKYCQLWVQVAVKGSSSSSSSGGGKATGTLHRFDGFRSADFSRVNDHTKSAYSTHVTKRTLGSTGQTWGSVRVSEEGGELEFRDLSGALVAPLPLSAIAAAALPLAGELEIQLADEDVGDPEDECLVEMRLYIPRGEGGGGEGEGEEEDEEGEEGGGKSGSDPAESLRARIIAGAGIRGGQGPPLVELPDTVGSFQVPRGRFAIEFYPAFLRLLGSSYEFKVAYKSIARITYLPLPASSGSYTDATRFALVISLIDPLRQGVQRHPHLVLQLDKKPVTVPLAIPEEDRAAGRYEGLGGGGETSLSGDLPKLVGSLFKKLTGKPVYKCESFESGGVEKQRGVRCNYKSSPGVLFPLEKSVIFIHKPTLLIMYSDVEKITATMSSMNTLFDLSVQCRAVGGEGRKEYVFGQLDKKEYGALTKFFGDKGVKVIEVKSAVAQAGYVDMKQLDDAIAGEDEGEDDDDEDASIKDEDDEDEDEDEDADEGKGRASKKSKKKGGDDSDDEGFVRKGLKKSSKGKGKSKSSKRKRGGDSD